jgi:hypothetical protein
MKTQNELTQVELNLAKRIKTYQPGECPPGEQLVELAELGRKCPDYDERIDHVALCSNCYHLFVSLQEVETLHQQTFKREPLLDKLLSLGIRREEGRLYENKTLLPGWVQNLLQPLATAPAMAAAYRSTALAAPGVQLLQPDAGNQALEDTNPLFAWEPVPGAPGYEVKLDVMETQWTEMPGALPVEGTTARLKPGLQLEEQREYRLRIQPLPDIDSFSLTPLAEETVFAFKVLSEAERKQLEWARANVKQTPLSSGMTLYHLGFFAEALGMVELWQESEVKEQWLSTIRQVLAMRRTDPSRLY